MVFLNPSILFGLLAASIPLIIHLLNFRKLKKVEFSTLTFLKELQKSKIKKVKIKQWILLLLRTLIIVCLVLAFARPTLEGVSLIGGSSTAKASTLFILDNSFSMSYIGDDGSYLNKSKKIAKDIVSQLEDGDELILLFSTDSVIATTNKESFLKQIDNLDLSLVTESTLEKLQKASKTLAGTQNINKEIFLFSDFQETTFSDKTIIDSINTLNATDGIKLYSFNISQNNRSNIAITNFMLENSILELNRSITFSAKFRNFSTSNSENILASLFINNKRVAQKNISFDTKKEIDLQFTSILNNSGFTEARIELEEDNILQDNKRYLSFYVPEKIKVLIEFDNVDDITFIEAALNSSSVSDQILITKNNTTSYSSFNPNDFDILFFVAGKANSTLENFVASDKNIILIPPSKANIENLGSISAVTNLPLAQNIITSELDENNYNEISKINWDHPILQNLFETGNNNFESPNFYKYIKFTNSANVSSIISLLDNSIFLGEYDLNNSKVLFFNTSVNLTWSNLPIKGIFAPLIARCVNYLNSINNRTKTFLTSESIPVDISTQTVPLLEVELPVGSEKINLDKYSQNIFNYTRTNLIGNYKFNSNNKLISFASVNTNPKESDLSGISTDTLVSVYDNLFKDNYLIFNSGENYYDKIKQARYGTELWKYLIILALLFALIEMFIARSTKKDIATITK